MVFLNFTLTPSASSLLHDVLFCLSRFSDTVSLQARRENLTLSALNPSKSGHASYSLDGKFFSSYEFKMDDGRSDGRFTCAITNKALMSVFKSRLSDPRGFNAIERCEGYIKEQADEAECRFVIKMICERGVVKTYQLTYESVEVMHALFDRNSAANRWSIKSSFLKEFIEYFSPKTEQLDIYHEDDKVTFLSFTDKIVGAKNEILKQPLKTAVLLNMEDFDHFSVQENLHIIISVKDFRAVVTHADTMKATVEAFYSNPGRPLQFSYQKDGLQCQFTLMTAGENRGTPTPSATLLPSRRTSVQPRSTASKPENTSFQSREMPPPSNRVDRRRNARTLGQRDPDGQPSASFQTDGDPESLFVPNGEEDRLWDPQNLQDDEEMLAWDATENNENSFQPTIHDSVSISRSRTEETVDVLEPTQRLSQIPRLF